MELKFVEQRNGKNILQMDDCRIVYRNFSGLKSTYNLAGERNFAVIIPEVDIADALVEDKNEYGIGWNVKRREAKDEGDDPFMYLLVKVKYSNGRGPKIYLQTGGVRNELDESSVGIIDKISIAECHMDIRPWDNSVNGKPFRAAYLQSMLIVQNIDRFAAEEMNSKNDSEEE